MKLSYLFLLAAVVIGALAPIQGGINSQLSQYLKNPVQASFISFTGGVITLFLILLILNVSFPPLHEMKKIPWYLFIGGVLGVAFVTTVIVLIPRIGATNLMAGIIVGQLVMSLVADHFGILKIPVQEITWPRVLGVIMLLAGFFLIQKT